MSGQTCWPLILLVVILLPGQDNAARILGFFPVPSRSHMIVFSALTRALAERGHELVVVNNYPLKDPPANYTDVDLWDTLKGIYDDTVNEHTYALSNLPTITLPMLYWIEGVHFMDLVLHDPKVNQVINDTRGFDLVIVEDFLTDSSFALAHHFQAPLVLISSMGGFHWTNYAVGNAAPTSYVPNTMLSYGSKMTFFERFVNTMYQWYWDVGSTFYLMRYQEKIKREIFPDAPSIYELRRSASLVLLNNHFSFNYPRPLVPNLVEVGGMHLKPLNRPLPIDIKEWLDGAKHGVIYFSMGSNLRGTWFPERQRKAFIEAFAELPQRVLWKWESDSIPDQSKNVKVYPWMPQQEILAHPNVKVFITHGGLLGAQEAMYNAVPLISIPVACDQYLNAKRAELGGYGLQLHLRNITKESVKWAIKTALFDKKIRAEAKRRSEIFHDQPETPLERAVFWVEYVLRHKGAPHLRSASLGLHWMQEALLDVYAVMAFMSLVFMYISYLLVKRAFIKTKAKLIDFVQVSKKKLQ